MIPGKGMEPLPVPRPAIPASPDLLSLSPAGLEEHEANTEGQLKWMRPGKWAGAHLQTGMDILNKQPIYRRCSQQNHKTPINIGFSIPMFDYRKVWQKHPAGPETVLVKAQLCFFVLNELGTMVKSNFCCKKHPEMDSKFCLFSRFTTVSAHFHWSILVHAENTFFFFRRCVSMLRWFRWSSVASWHWGWCTSIAKIWDDELLGNVSL